jgi:hypothetical protein
MESRAVVTGRAKSMIVIKVRTELLGPAPRRQVLERLPSLTLNRCRKDSQL